MSSLLRRRAGSSPAARAYRAAGSSPGSTPWKRARFAVVDLETTGLDPRRDELVSFASVPIEAGRVRIGATRAATIRPDVMPTAETIRIHGLRASDLAEAPPLSEVLDVILDALAGRHLVAHVAWIERSFLAAALKPTGLRLPKHVIDTATLTRRVLGSQMAGAYPPPLSEAARQLGLPVHRPHFAEGDALTTAQLFLALATHLDDVTPQTVSSLARLSKG